MSEVAADAAARRLAQREFARPLVLEAGAGTGKTAVLVARIVAWCLGPGWERARERSSDPAVSHAALASDTLRRVVAITFTEAAAAEMATRVGQLLLDIRRGQPPEGLETEGLGAEPGQSPPAPEELAERVEALVGALDQLTVRTIHAYCRRLLVAYPLEAGLHPGFDIDADERGQREIARDTVEAALGRLYGAEPDPDALALADRRHGPMRLQEALVALLGEGVPPEVLERDPTRPEVTARLRAVLAEAASPFMAAGGDRLAPLSGSRTRSAAQRVAELVPVPGVPSDPSRQAFVAWLEALQERVEDADLGRLADWSKGKFNKGEGEALGDDAPALAAAAGPVVSLLRRIRRLDLVGFEHGRRVLAPLLAEASGLLRTRGVETYGALLRDARNLLRDHPAVAGRLRREIDQLLVDEFQDTDAIQCQLLASLALGGSASERPGLFLVGDPKQSIYGWRNADLRAYQGFLDRVCAEGGQVASLVVNFRSAPAILDEVDRVIAPVMQPEPGLQPAFASLEPSESTRSQSGFSGDGFAPVEHWVSWSFDRESGEPEPGAAVRLASRLEAEAVARDLVRLRERGVALSNVALLFRSGGDFDIYLGALREAGIRFVVERDTHYYERREIIEATALISCILDPNDHLALVAVLRSALVGMPDAALIPLWLESFPSEVGRLYGPFEREGELAQAVSRVAEELREQADQVPGLERVEGWQHNLLAFLAALAELRADYDRESSERFVERLRTRLLFEAGEASRYLGPYRVANLDRFLRDLVDALEESGGDVSAVLSHLRQAVSERREQEEGRPRSADEDAVQVMTIHKAKGLDFDHVYVLQLHKTSGRGAGQEDRAVPWEDGTELSLFGAPTPGLVLADADRARVDECERIRLLYVAMTRARERLVLAGRWPSKPSRVASHVELLARRRPAAPPLVETMQSLFAAGRSRHEDADGVCWRFPALEPAAEPRASRSASESRGEALPSADRVREESRTLAERRAAARAHSARPFQGVASDEEKPAELVESQASRTEEQAPPTSRAPVTDRERLRAMAAGTAVHAALEGLGQDPSGERAQAEIDSSLAGLGEEDRRAARARALEIWDRFRQGPLSERLERLGPHVVARELPVLLPPEEAPGAPVGYVSGAIDLVYRDPDSQEWVVVDYKTDRLETEAEIEERAGLYRGQGRVYQRALREALELDEDPRFELWFLHPGRAVPV